LAGAAIGGGWELVGGCASAAPLVATTLKATAVAAVTIVSA
jgi:hypothetical protein